MTIKTQKRKTILLYTALYIALAAGIFGWFALCGKTLINKSDAFEQHINALMVYGKWLRGYLYHVIKDHSLLPQNYSFGIGYGGDFQAAMQYYVVGDPLNIPAAVLPTKYIYYYYQFLVVLRPYLAGLSFLALCMHRAGRLAISKSAAITGALTYSFCGTVLFIGMWNPFFVNPMIILPLMVLGADLILEGEKRGPLLFILSVFYASVCNFYFFYMLVLLIIGYVLIHLVFFRNQNPKAALSVPQILVRFIICGIIGTMMGMVILLPVVLLFLNNPRGSGHSYTAFYPPAYYRELFQNLISYVYHPQYDTELGFTFLAVPVLILLLLKAAGALASRLRKKAGETEPAESGYILTSAASLLVCLLMLLIPFFGFAMNGFAYMINRWAFAVALIVSWSVVLLWEDLTKSELKQALITSAGCALYALILVLSGLTGRSPVLFKSTGREYPGFTEAAMFNVRAQVLLLAVFVVIILVRAAISRKESARFRFVSPILVFLSVAAIMINGYCANAPEMGNLPNGYLDAEGPDAWMLLNTATEIKAIDETTAGAYGTPPYYRYSGRNLSWNMSLMNGTSSTQFYWSLTNGNISRFLNEMAVNEMANYSVFGLDDRAGLLALAGVKYYSLRFDEEREWRFVPEGFVRLGEYYNYAIYENAFPLDLGYTCKKVIPEADYREMTPIMRQQALLGGVVLNGQENAGAYGLPAADVTFSDVSIPWKLDLTEGASFEITPPASSSEAGSEAAPAIQPAGGVFTAQAGGETVTLNFKGLPQCETYLYIKGLHFDGNADFINIPVSSYMDSEDPYMQKVISFKESTSQFYSGWHDYLVNFGYADQGQSAVTITFPMAGTYSFEDLQIICLPASSYLQAVDVLRQHTLQNIDMHKNPVSFMTNEVTGTITSDGDSLLVLTIPYENGWSAFVDGSEVPVMQANTLFMAVPVSDGEHQVRLTYQTPGLAAGLVLSIAGFILLFLYVRMTGRKAGILFKVI